MLRKRKEELGMECCNFKQVQGRCPKEGVFEQHFTNRSMVYAVASKD